MQHDGWHIVVTLAYRLAGKWHQTPTDWGKSAPAPFHKPADPSWSDALSLKRSFLRMYRFEGLSQARNYDPNGLRGLDAALRSVIFRNQTIRYEANFCVTFRDITWPNHFPVIPATDCGDRFVGVIAISAENIDIVIGTSIPGGWKHCPGVIAIAAENIDIVVGTSKLWWMKTS